jgi:hypothetical protein
MQPPRQSDCCVVFGVSPALAGFPIALSVEEGATQGWFAVHILIWFVAVAWRRQGVAEGGAA